MRRILIAALLVAAVGGCPTSSGLVDHGSTVEYVPIAAAPARPADALPGARPHHAADSASSAVASRRSRGTVVRVVPIHEHRSADGSVARVASRAPAGGADASALIELLERDRGEAEPQRPDGPAADGAPDDPLPGIVAPYSLRRIFRGFGACRGNRHFHEAIDIGGVGPDLGLGTPVVAMTRSRVKYIGRGADDPGEFGRPDTRGGTTIRGHTRLPRSKVIDGYGRVHFFTRTYGRWRSGTVLVTEGVGGPLDRHEIRYMHLGAVKPDLQIGQLLEPGDEIGLLGGTGVQRSAPHIHIDVEDPDGQRVDVAPLLGLPPTARPCPEARADGEESRVWTVALQGPRCGETWTRREDFESGEYYAHDLELEVGEGDRLDVSLARTAGSWSPRVEIADGGGTTVYMGSTPTPAGRATDLRARRKLSGRRGSEAAVRVDARGDATAVVRVTAWPQEAPGLLLPKDGRYTLTITRRCAD